MNSRTTFLCFLCNGLVAIMTSITNGVYQDQYIGCFYGSSATSFTEVFSNGNSSNIEKCIQLCQTNTTSTYAAIKNEILCSCEDEYGVQVLDDNCNLTCSAQGRKTCSGVIRYPNAYVLFSVCPIGTYGSSCQHSCHCKRELQCSRMTGACPHGCHGIWTGDQCNSSANLSQQYIGCFADVGNNRSMTDCVECSGIHVPMTLQLCTEKCSQRNRMYAGAQFRYQCFCGDMYEKFGPLNETSCDLPCAGNKNEICGGAHANSVYHVCPAGNYGKSCAGRCHCLNGGRCFQSNGSCPLTGTLCESGWKGDSCNIRDCDQNNGDCSSNETCYTITLNSAAITACRCSEGYQHKYDWNNCRDLDECSLSPPPCDPLSSTCSNSIGSFQCICKAGYTQNITTSYIDIDECTTDVCDKATTSCCNTLVSGFSAGAMAGTILGSVVGISVIFGIVIIAVYLFRRKRRSLERTEESSETAQHQNQWQEEVGDLDLVNSYTMLRLNRENEENASYATLKDINSSEPQYENIFLEYAIQDPPEDISTRCESQIYEEVR